jgi:HEAT repeat protein
MMPEPRDLAVSDPVARRRRAAAVAGHIGDVETARAAGIDPDPSVRATALGALHRAGALTPDDLLAAFADTAPTVRRRAVTLAADHAEVPILTMLTDPDDRVVEAAAWACGERPPGEPGVVEALVVLGTRAEDPMVREAAVAALGAIGDPAGLPAVLAGTHDKPAVRRRAVLALAAFDGPEVDAAVARALVDRDWQVRQAAEDIAGPLSP